MAFEELIQELHRQKEKARAQGGPAKIAKQHEKGRLTARERIEALLDRGSFLELGALCTSDIPGMEDKTPADGLILGIKPSVVFEECSIMLQQNDTLLLYTDGIPEAMDPHGELLGNGRVCQHLTEQCTQPAAVIADSFRALINNYTQSTTPQDDISLVVVKIEA